MDSINDAIAMAERGLWITKPFRRQTPQSEINDELPF